MTFKKKNEKRILRKPGRIKKTTEKKNLSYNLNSDQILFYYGKKKNSS